MSMKRRVQNDTIKQKEKSNNVFVNRRLNMMDPSIQVVGKPVQRTGQWHVVYVQEKSGKTRCNKNDYVNSVKINLRRLNRSLNLMYPPILVVVKPAQRRGH